MIESNVDGVNVKIAEDQNEKYWKTVIKVSEEMIFNAEKEIIIRKKLIELANKELANYQKV